MKRGWTVRMTTLLTALFVQTSTADIFQMIEAGIDRPACDSALLSGSLKYVATNGNDATGDGTLQNPYRTVFHAVEEAQSGDTVVIRGGTYAETGEIRVRIPDVTIRSYPGEWAVLDRTSGDAENWESGVYLDVDSDNARVECLEIIGGFDGIATETRWEWGDPNDRGGPENIRIENAVIHGAYAEGVKVKPQSNNFTISHCEIYNTGVGQDPSDCNAEGIDNVNADRMHVTHTYIHNTCSTGVYCKGGSQDCLIEYSLIEETGEGGILLGFDTSPDYFDTENNPDYYEAIRPVARYNLVRGAKGAGIGLFASKDARVAYNTVINSSTRYHAPLHFGVVTQDWDENAGRPDNSNPTIEHNIFAQLTVQSAWGAMVYIRHNDDLGGLDGLSGPATLKKNCYYDSHAAAIFFDGREEWGSQEYLFPAWQQHINSDFTSVETDPQFDGDYKPQNPLCRNKGYLARPASIVPILFLLN